MTEQQQEKREELERKAVEMVIEWRSSPGYKNSIRIKDFLKHVTVGREFLEASAQRSYYAIELRHDVDRLIAIAAELGLVSTYCGLPVGRTPTKQHTEDEWQAAMLKLDRLDLSHRRNAQLKGIVGQTDRFRIIELIRDKLLQTIADSLGDEIIDGKTRDELVEMTNWRPIIINDLVKYLVADRGWVEKKARRGPKLVRVLKRPT
jgi:hypothetical protein